MDEIRIDVGVYTALEVDLTDFDFSGVQKVILTVKNKLYSRIAFEREFTDPRVHTVIVTPNESERLREGAEYDFTVIATSGERFKNGDNGAIVLRRGCGVVDADD